MKITSVLKRSYHCKVAPSPATAPFDLFPIGVSVGHESNGTVAGDRTSNQMVPLPLPLLGTNQMAPLPGMVPLYSDITFSEYLHVDYD